jgi:2-succinyl-5-enolpyruvyl-6-hydroxy-3-cyclohexene-1-carboxylate synthase
MWNLAERNVDVRIIVVNNSGGSIFSFLPQGQQLEHARFEQLFGTPHAVDVCGLARAHGVRAIRTSTLDELRAALRQPGPIVIEAITDRDANVAEHERINSAMAAAVRSTLE